MSNANPNPVTIENDIRDVIRRANRPENNVPLPPVKQVTDFAPERVRGGDSDRHAAELCRRRSGGQQGRPNSRELLPPPNTKRPRSRSSSTASSSRPSSKKPCCTSPRPPSCSARKPRRSIGTSRRPRPGRPRCSNSPRSSARRSTRRPRQRPGLHQTHQTNLRTRRDGSSVRLVAGRRREDTTTVLRPVPPQPYR